MSLEDIFVELKGEAPALLERPSIEYGRPVLVNHPRGSLPRDDAHGVRRFFVVHWRGSADHIGRSVTRDVRVLDDTLGICWDVKRRWLGEEMAAFISGAIRQRQREVLGYHRVRWHVRSECELDVAQRKELLKVLDDRYKVGPTIVTSQLEPKDWHPVIGDPTLADAICDRLVHNAHRIKLAGESVRKAEGLTA